MDRRYQLVCGLILLLLLGAAGKISVTSTPHEELRAIHFTAENIRCGRSVEFQLSEVHHCLTTSGAAVALIRRTSDQVLMYSTIIICLFISPEDIALATHDDGVETRQCCIYCDSQELKVLKLVPEQKLELGVQGKDAVLNLTSFFPVCYVLSVGQCVQTIGEGSHQRNIRNAPRIVSPTKGINVSLLTVIYYYLSIFR